MRCVFVIFIVFAAWVSCKRVPRHVLYGKCYDVITPLALNLTAWTTGKWYEIKRYDNAFEHGSDCASHVYFLNAENKNLDAAFNLRYGNGSLGIIQGQINYTLAENEINLFAQYPEDSAASSFDVLATDVDSYAIVYSCWQISNDTFLPEKQERLWVLSRESTMTNVTLEVVKNALVVNGTDWGRYLDDVSQENC